MFRSDSEGFLPDRFIIPTKADLGVSKNSYDAFSVSPKILTEECRREQHLSVEYLCRVMPLWDLILFTMYSNACRTNYLDDTPGLFEMSYP